MNLYYDAVLVGRKQDGSPIYAKDLRTQLEAANETIRRNEGRRLFELCVQHGAQPGHVLDWLRDRLQARQMPEGFALVPVEANRDAERYRFLEHQCATGSYRGIISRKAIDAAMIAAAQQGAKSHE